MTTSTTPAAAAAAAAAPAPSTLHSVTRLAAGTGAILGVVLAGVLYTPGPPFPSKGSIKLENVPRILASETTMRQLLQDGTPKIIEFDLQSRWNFTKMKALCGHRHVSLISEATYTTLMQLPESIIKITEMMMFIFGKPINFEEELIRRARFPFVEYVDDVLAQEQSNFWLPYIFRFLPSQIRMLFDILMRPLYLHDVPLARICPEILKDIRIPRFMAVNHIHLQPGAQIQDEAKNNPFLFFGPKDSMSYPMHQNIFPADVLMVMMEGSKAFTVFHPSQSENLHPVGIETSLFEADGLNPDLFITPRLKNAKGWKGKLEAGEILFLPSYYIHQFQNESPGPNIGLKFWIGTQDAVCLDGDCTQLIKLSNNKMLKKLLSEKTSRSISIDQYRKVNRELLRVFLKMCAKGTFNEAACAAMRRAETSM